MQFSKKVLCLWVWVREVTDEMTTKNAGPNSQNQQQKDFEYEAERRYHPNSLGMATFSLFLRH